MKNIREVFRRVPLPEDVMLKGLPVLMSSHDAMDWEYLHHHCLNAKEEVSVTMCQDFLRLSQSDVEIEVVIRGRKSELHFSLVSFYSIY
jgi:hypothetical protein